jgi:hypothetical protein
MSWRSPAEKASPAGTPSSPATTEAPAATATEWDQKPTGPSDASSARRLQAALTARARTVEKPSSTTARAALPTLRDSP